jgi:hypothetical protein
MNKQKIYFITYGTKDYRLSSKHLIKMAKKASLFEDCINYDFNSLSSDFKSLYQDILSHQKGDGYWVWKHEIIMRTLDEIKDNDLVVYCDAGSSFNFYASERFMEYVSMLNNSEFGNFRIETQKQFLEKHFTVKELMDYFQIPMDSTISNSTQFEAGHMIFKKNTHTKNYFQVYKELLTIDPLLITDEYNSLQKEHSFVSSRHDQSIFSLISKKYGSISIENESYFKNNESLQYDAPFLAVRSKKHGPRDHIKYYLNTKKFREPNYF